MLGQRALEQAGYHLAKPVLTRLADATGESVSLGVRRNQEVVVVERATSPQPLGSIIPPAPSCRCMRRAWAR